MHCSICGFTFDDVSPGEVSATLCAASAELQAVIRGAETSRLRRRPSPRIWSPLEYTCHIRDVLLEVRSRMALAVVEDDPVFAPMHRDERARIARYSSEDPNLVLAGHDVATSLLAWLFEGLTALDLERTGHYAGEPRTILWMGRQAVHESVHHLQDVVTDLRPHAGADG